jgi:hypothetical protein
MCCMSVTPGDKDVKSTYPLNISVIELGLRVVPSAFKLEAQIHPDLSRTVHADFFTISRRPQKFPWAAQVDPVGAGGSRFVWVVPRSALTCVVIRYVRPVVPWRAESFVLPRMP